MKIKLKRIASLCVFLTACLYSAVSLNDAEIDSRAYIVGKQLYTEGLLTQRRLGEKPQSRVTLRLKATS